MTALQDDLVNPSSSQLALSLIVANPPRAHTDLLHPRLASSLCVVVRSTRTSGATLERRLARRPQQLSRAKSPIRRAQSRLLPESRMLFRPRGIRSGRTSWWVFGRWGRLEPLDFAVVHACFSCYVFFGEARRRHVQFADGGVEGWFRFA